MSPAPKTLLLPMVIAVLLSCSVHRPWDKSVPAAARTRWRLGQDIFASVARDVKLIDPDAHGQDYAVRRAAESALLSITAHVRLPADPARTRRLVRQLRQAGFTFAASVLGAPAMPKDAAPDPRLRLAVRDWSGLARYPLTEARVKATSTEELVRLIRDHLHDPSGAVAIWALELSGRKIDAGLWKTGGLDCASWQQLTTSAVGTHSERVLVDLWPALRAACTIDELQAWTEALDGRLPEVLRLFGEAVGFPRRIRVCTATGARFPANALRGAFLQLPAPTPADLALGLLCSDPDFLTFSLSDPALEALRLHLAGQTGAALAHLADRAPADTATARLDAGRLALSFGDRTAALGHFRWAAALAQHPVPKATAYHYQRLAARFTAEEEWTALAEQWRLDPAGTSRELWLAGHWPAIVLLSGRAPAPHAAEAARALADFLAYRPDGGALAPYWRGLMGEENLKKVWPGSETKPPRRSPQPARGTVEPPAPAELTPSWHGDFHSDLARLLQQPLPAASWEAFFARHGAHPQSTTVAELALVLHPDSHRHGLTAAGAFLLRSDPGRALAALRTTSAARSDRAATDLDFAELFLRRGFRHEAAAAMRDWFAWKEAFLTPQERDREDWRLDANLKLIEFFWRAGFNDLAQRRLARLLEAARGGDPLRLSRVATLAALRFPSQVGAHALARTTENPLLLLRLAVGRPAFSGGRDHVLSQLAILLPDAPEVAWTACIWQDLPAVCLDAQAVGVASPEGLRLPILLSILDRLTNRDTARRPDDLRLALHVARRRTRDHADWRFVEAELENE